MKRLIGLIFCTVCAVFCAFFIGGCSGGSTAAEPPPAPTVVEKNPDAGVSVSPPPAEQLPSAPIEPDDSENTPPIDPPPTEGTQTPDAPTENDSPSVPVPPTSDEENDPPANGNDDPGEVHIHTPVYVEGIDATCEADGVSAHYSCVDCGLCFIDAECSETVEDTVIAALGHSYGDFTVIEHPTCTGGGIKAKVCERCDTTIEETAIPASGHDWHYGNVLKEAKCTANGKILVNCERCGISEVRDVEATGHEWEEEYTVDITATCAANGQKSRHCKNCDERTDVTETEKKEHRLTDWETVAAPDCTHSGERRRVCSDCGYIRSETIEATGHSYAEEWKSDENSHWRECVCGDVAYRADHSLSDGECSVCGYAEMLEFAMNSDGTYSVVGIGSFKGSEIAIPETYKGAAVTSIGDGAFKNNYVITRVFIPRSVKLIGKEAFKGCSALREVEFEQTDGWFTATKSTASNGTRVDVKRTIDNMRKLTVSAAGFYWINKK